MSDDVLFVAVGSAGALFGLWRVVAGRLAGSTGNRLLGVVAIGLVGSLLWGGVQSVVDGGGFLDHRADVAAGALLFVVMALPLWGLFDERILARVGEVGIASVGLAAGYRLADRVGPAIGLTIAVASILVAALGAGAPGGGLRRLIGYAWFLAGAVVLAITEAEGALDPLVEDVIEVRPGAVFAAFGALVWLAFHGAFAAKFVLIAFTCVRRRGRELAYAFSDRVVLPAHTSVPIAAALLAFEGAVLLSDHVSDWADDTVVVAVVIFALPLVERLAARASTAA